MKVIGLFSGIGGFELAFQREGFEVVSVCEIDPYCQKVLAAHFPKAKLNPDIRSCSLEDFHAKTSPSLEGKRGSKESEAGSGLSSCELLRQCDQISSSLKMWATPGGVGCPNCGGRCTHLATPPYRYECEPLTWEPPTVVPESSLLPTPTASAYGSCRGGGSGRVGKWRKSLDSLGYTNPAYREWMMGFPIGWSETQLSVTPLSRKSRKSSRGGLKR